jgi:hypothetical protein
MATYVLTIGGTTVYPMARSVRIAETMNGANRMDFSLDYNDGSYRPELGEEVIFTEDGDRIFGGLISESNERSLAECGAPIITDVSVADFSTLASFRIVNEVIPAGNLKAALIVLQTYLDDYGVTLDVSQANGVSLEELVAVDRRLDELLDDLAVASGWPWEIDYDKVLRMRDPSGVAAPFDLNESNGLTRGDITVSPSRNEGYANRVILKSPPVTRYEYEETFTGDGSTTDFVLTGQAVRTYGGVTYDGNFETLGESGSGATWIIDAATSTISRTPAPGVGLTISVVYDGVFTAIAQSDDAGEQAANGLREVVIIAAEGLSQEVLQDLADGELATRTQTYLTVRYVTVQLGVRPGMTQGITESYRQLSGYYLVTQVDTSDESDGEELTRSVTAISATRFQGSWRDIYKLWAKGGGSSSGSSTIIATGVSTGGSGGSVSSVGLSVPSSLLTVSGTPVTSTGTIAVGLALQNANTVFAGPTSGSAATPTVRALVSNDLPSNLNTGTTIGSAYIYRVGGAEVPVDDGGTGRSGLTVNGVLYGNGTSPIPATAQGGTHTVLAADNGAPFFTTSPTVTDLTATASVATTNLTALGYAAITGALSAAYASITGLVASATMTASTSLVTPLVTASTSVTTPLITTASGPLTLSPAVTASTSVTSPLLVATTSVTTPLIATASGNLALTPVGSITTTRPFVGLSGDFSTTLHADGLIDSDYAVITPIVSSYTDLTLNSNANLVLHPTGDIILDPVGDDVYPYTNYDINLGTTTNKFLRGFIAELVVDTLVAREVVSTIGGSILVAVTSEITSDLSSAATSIVLKHNDFASGDRIRMEARGQVEWMSLTSGPSGGGGVPGTLAFVNRAEGTFSSSARGSVAIAATSHTAGNLLVVNVSRHAATSVTVSDTAGNTYSSTGVDVTNGSNHIEQWYAWNILGHASNVVTVTLSSGTAAYFNASVVQFSGAETASDPFVDADSASGSSSAPSTGVLSISGSTVLVALIQADGSSINGGSGFTRTVWNGGSGDGIYFADEYKIVSSSQVADATSGSAPWAMVGSSFKVYVSPGGSGPYTYSVTRNLDGTGANNWIAGDAVVNTGTTGSGHINLYAETGILSGIGPTIVGNVRTGATYSDVSPRWAIGNLNGLYGYSSSTFGVAIGNYSGIWLSMDDTNGFQVKYGGTTRIQLATSGNATFVGQITAASGSIGGWILGSDYIRDNADTTGLASTYTGGDDIRFWAGDTFANRASAPFQVRQGGTIIASNAVITGGTIGGWVLGSDYIRDNANTTGMASTYTGGDDIRYWAGDTFANRATAPFQIRQGGTVIASNAVITGGTIGGWTIGADYLRDAANSFGFASTVSGSDDVRLWVGDTFANRATAPFRIFESGAAVIGGFSIASNFIRDIGNSFGLSSIVTGGDDVRMWAGDTESNRAIAPFRVTEAGLATMVGATITGPDILVGVSTAYTPSGAYKFQRPSLTAASGDVYALYAFGVSSVQDLHLENTVIPTTAANIQALTTITAQGYKTTGGAASTGPAILQMRSDLSAVRARFSIGNSLYFFNEGYAQFGDSTSGSGFPGFALGIGVTPYTAGNLGLAVNVTPGSGDLEFGNAAGGTLIQSYDRANAATKTMYLVGSAFSFSQGMVMIGSTAAASHWLEVAYDDAYKPSTSTWGIVSDAGTKEDSKPFGLGMAAIRGLTVKEAKYNGELGTTKGQRVVSIDAQDMKVIFPHAVKTVKREGQDVETVNMHEVIMATIVAVKELDARVTALGG